MTYGEFALIAASKGLRAAWDALMADPWRAGTPSAVPGEWECGDCGETVTGDWCLACAQDRSPTLQEAAKLADVVIQRR